MWLQVDQHPTEALFAFTGTMHAHPLVEHTLRFAVDEHSLAVSEHRESHVLRDNARSRRPCGAPLRCPD